MSKSLKNLVQVADLLTSFSSDAIRLYLLGTHYRQSPDYDEAELRRAAELATRLTRAAGGPLPNPRASGEGVKVGSTGGPFTERFFALMDDDLNTPAVLTLLAEMASAIEQAHAEGRDAEALQRDLREFGGVLGLHLGEGRAR